MGKEIGGSTCRQCGNRLGGGHCAERAEGPSVNSPQHPANKMGSGQSSYSLWPPARRSRAMYARESNSYPAASKADVGAGSQLYHRDCGGKVETPDWYLSWYRSVLVQVLRLSTTLGPGDHVTLHGNGYQRPLLRQASAGTDGGRDTRMDNSGQEPIHDLGAQRASRQIRESGVLMACRHGGSHDEKARRCRLCLEAGYNLLAQRLKVLEDERRANADADSLARLREEHSRYRIQLSSVRSFISFARRRSSDPEIVKALQHAQDQIDRTLR